MRAHTASTLMFWGLVGTWEPVPQGPLGQGQLFNRSTLLTPGKGQDSWEVRKK